MYPDLTISIINHSNPKMLRECLRSIYDAAHQITFNVCVIDNATDRRMVDEIRSEFPDVKWSFNPSPMGFSANHNQVLAAAEGRYVCILNDDTVVRDGAMDELVRFMDADPRVGLAGPRLLNADGSIQNSTFHDKTLLGELINIALLPGPANRLKMRGIDGAQFQDRPARVDWLLGACIVARRETVWQIGLLDDALSPVANCEEVDWCRRARQGGWEVAFVPSARVLHYGGQSMKSQGPGADRFRVELHRSILSYFQKHYGLLRTLLLRVIYVATLPWNGLMLAQSVLRGRTGKTEAASMWATFVQIGGVALSSPGRVKSAAKKPSSPSAQRPIAA
ncbi:MAG: glycosyltransferase family 2 protein [Tepidisphaeraceae bacterium]|jgi:GT2 family glycosyltransferase